MASSAETASGTPCWAGLTVPDRELAAGFYGPLLGWEFGEYDDGDAVHLVCTLGGLPAAGISQGPDTLWTTYLAVPDLAAAAARVGPAAGSILVPPRDVPGGSLAVAVDPAGAAVGLWQPAGPPVATGTGAMAWNECLTDELDAAVTFYTGVFGYGTIDMSVPGFRYLGLTTGGEPVCGLGELPADTLGEVPAHWVTYFSVADVDVATEKLASLGGRMLVPPFDDAQGSRLAVGADNQGTMLGLVSPPPSRRSW
ncbi:VOC family protein [Amycolatopsis suaedae]|uniref:VOC family protein n=1 Tax=Amycolatopsis suaedae TaxID=2510978 RepID=A0A4Q7J5B1_9PSEU|nr:VOC family protein [Amycolatopsis suaedae]RZQ62771.1 VOC family protein [Amycolatopsis suaedae]